MVRQSLSYVGWKERKAVAADLRVIYWAVTEAQAEQSLCAFEAKWDRKYPTISKNRGVFPHQDSILKLYWLALERISKKWTMPIANWSEALNRFAMEFGERMPKLD